MVEHQPRLLGSRVRFPAGAFAIFSVSAKASLPISLPPFPSSFFLSLPLPFLPLPFPSTFRLRLRPAGGVNHPDSVLAKVGKLPAKRALR